MFSALNMVSFAARPMTNLIQCHRYLHGFTSIGILRSLEQINHSINFQQVRGAKRKGARIKAQQENRKRANARRAAAADVKKGWIPPHLVIDKSKLKMGSRRFSDKALKEIPDDNVFHAQAFKRIFYPFELAIENHRETHDITMLNEPNAFVECRVEFDLRTKKLTKFVPIFSSTLNYPHLFEFKRERRIVALCKTTKDQEAALEAGAVMAGSTDIVKLIKTKKLLKDDFDHIVCHTDMIIQLSEVRGVLKDHFPNKIKGNFGTDMAQLTKKFIESVDYNCVRDDYENDYGWVEVNIGRLNMPNEQLKDNFVFLLQQLETYKPKDIPKEDYNGFITRVLIRSDPSKEEFDVRFWDYIQGYESFPDVHLVKPIDQINAIKSP